MNTSNYVFLNNVDKLLNITISTITYLKMKLIFSKHLFFVATQTIRCFYGHAIVLHLTKKLRLSRCQTRSRRYMDSVK